MKKEKILKRLKKLIPNLIMDKSLVIWNEENKEYDVTAIVLDKESIETSITFSYSHEKQKSSKNKFKYPSKKYHDYSNGVDIDDEQINQWIQAGIESIKDQARNDKKNVWYFTASGNAIIWINGYKQDNGKYDLAIRVCKNYSEFDAMVKLC